MPPLTLEEEENTDNEEEDEEENDEDNDDKAHSTEYNNEDNEEEEEEEDDMVNDTPPILCQECSLETVHECSEDRHVWREDQPISLPTTGNSEQLTGVQSPAAVYREEIQETINRLEACRTNPRHVGPDRPNASQGGDRTQYQESWPYGQEGPEQQKPPDFTDLVSDWQDFVIAIESIPGGAACGPDGVPANLLKKAKVPISRLMNKIFQSSLQTGEIPPI